MLEHFEISISVCFGGKPGFIPSSWVLTLIIRVMNHNRLKHRGKCRERMTACHWPLLMKMWDCTEKQAPAFLESYFPIQGHIAYICSQWSELASCFIWRKEFTLSPTHVKSGFRGAPVCVCMCVLGCLGSGTRLHIGLFTDSVCCGADGGNTWHNLDLELHPPWLCVLDKCDKWSEWKRWSLVLLDKSRL